MMGGLIRKGVALEIGAQVSGCGLVLAYGADVLPEESAAKTRRGSEEEDLEDSVGIQQSVALFHRIGVDER